MRQQVVGIAAQEIAFPDSDQVVLQRRAAGLAPQFVAIKGLRHRPAGIDPAHPPQAALGNAGEIAILVMRIGRQRCLHAFKEDMVVRRGPGCAANHRQPLHARREQRRPVIRLHAAHGPAAGQRQPFDAEGFFQHALLYAHVVRHGETRPAAAVRGRRRIGGRRRKAIAELVGYDDEVTRRVQRAAGPDQPFNIGMLRAEWRHQQDDVGAFRIKRAIGLVGQARAAKGAAGVQHDVACLVNLIVQSRSLFVCAANVRQRKNSLRIYARLAPRLLLREHGLLK